MEWPKLKNIILVILVITNLCLFVFVAVREIQDNQLQRQARLEAITFLSDRGVAVQDEQVPQKMTLLPQTVQRELEQEGALAAALLEGAVQNEYRGGEVYRYYNEMGSIQFHSDGSFTADLTPKAFPLSGDPVQECLKLLERLEFQGELVTAQQELYTFRQLWQGTPLFTQQVTLEVEDGCLVAMTAGRRLVGQPQVDNTQSTISVVTALVDFLNGLNTLGDVCSRIDSIAQGYVCVASLSGPMILTPVWRIATDTGAYQIDLVTGGLSRLA